ncbi:hypothetical protein K6U06_00280 [Acidiferrimicrobium sp. IK]|uniref:hypothetical protein n=1 Tax=Acidiferrimicrobium sp. IK TaxID=2871700 RepID=UPI0021CB1D22|nr:hypothetical protein [Acidiferrimicrobium sp. IK]MCU4182783.1 hypothetical protein [Acidiferrimicrobium sp. IK]
MPDYKVNDAAVKKARQLIADGKVDTDTSWSDDSPSTDEQNAMVDQHGYDAFGEWHLAIDPDAGEETKSRYRFPYGDFTNVSRAGVIHAKQRASQNGHRQVAEAAADLLRRIDDRGGA